MQHELVRERETRQHRRERNVVGSLVFGLVEAVEIVT
jgi:hypothetical protein